MDKETFKNLKPGDIVRSVGSTHGYVVSGNYGERVTAVRTVDMTNPDEWELIDPPSGEYCRCKQPAFAPFIECEKCGLPPSTGYEIRSNVCPDCGAMLVFGGCLNCAWKRAFPR